MYNLLHSINFGENIDELTGKARESAIIFKLPIGVLISSFLTLCLRQHIPCRRHNIKDPEEGSMSQTELCHETVREVMVLGALMIHSTLAWRIQKRHFYYQNTICGSQNLKNYPDQQLCNEGADLSRRNDKSPDTKRCKMMDCPCLWSIPHFSALAMRVTNSYWVVLSLVYFGHI